VSPLLIGAGFVPGRQPRRIPAAVRWALAAAVTVPLVAGAPAGATQVDPRALTLQAGDVPRAFVVDRPNTMVVPNAAESNTAKGRERVRRSGRVTGYRATYVDPRKRQGIPRSIASQFGRFRRDAGAQVWFTEFTRDARSSGAPPFPTRVAARIGDEGRLWASPGVVVVFWRYGRAFATVTTTFVSREQTVALARAQQRRIATALR